MAIYQYDRYHSSSQWCIYGYVVTKADSLPVAIIIAIKQQDLWSVTDIVLFNCAIHFYSLAFLKDLKYTTILSVVLHSKFIVQAAIFCFFQTKHLIDCKNISDWSSLIAASSIHNNKILNWCQNREQCQWTRLSPNIAF